MIIQKKKNHYADKLSTPKETFKQCEKIWRVKCNIDTSADKRNKKCRRYITKEQDYLTKTDFKRTDILWGNFPHSQNGKFVEHTFNLWKSIGCRAVLLLPVNTLCSNYGKRFILHKAKIAILTGRIKFLRPISQKDSEFNSVNGYVTIYYGRRRKNNSRHGKTVSFK